MSNENKATELRVQIKRQEITTVDLTFPIFTLTMIDQFIPEKAYDYLSKEQIDFAGMMEKIKASNYAPQTVLQFEHEEKKFHIWIE